MWTDFLSQIKYYGAFILEDWQIKSLFSSVLVFVLDYTGISIMLYATLALVIFLDVVFGIWCAIRNNEFQFTRLKKWINKVFVYGLCIVLFSMADYFLSHGSFHILAQLVVSLIGITEIVSILGHCVTLGLPVPLMVHKIAENTQKKIENKIHTLDINMDLDVQASKGKK